MRVICGCGSSFKRSGLRVHQIRSNDIRCQAILTDSTDLQQEANEEPPNDTNGWGPTEMPDEFRMEIDPKGDYFGDYVGYTSAELVIEPAADGDQEEPGESEDEEFGVEDQDQGVGLEPERIFMEPVPQGEDDNVGDRPIPAMRLRGGAEENLQKKPFVVKFSKGRAGAVYSQGHGNDRDTVYANKISDPGNPYSPFASKLEWEIAYWAKTRGPSSTAFTELMKIEGVSEIQRTVMHHAHSLSGSRAPGTIIQEHGRAEQTDR